MKRELAQELTRSARGSKSSRSHREPSKSRRVIAFLIFLVAIGGLIFANIQEEKAEVVEEEVAPAEIVERVIDPDAPKALEKLDEIEIKGRAPKTGYSRNEFGNGWGQINGCDARNVILFRDLTDIEMRDNCVVASGTLHCPYTNKIIPFVRGENSSEVHIDHVVALSDAWQKGAQSWDRDKRIAFSNDPMNLLAVDGPANQQKGDSDAASWLPSVKSFRCQFVARMVSVKLKWGLWNTQAETDAMRRVLETCPNEPILQ